MLSYFYFIAFIALIVLFLSTLALKIVNLTFWRTSMQIQKHDNNTIIEKPYPLILYLYPMNNLTAKPIKITDEASIGYSPSNTVQLTCSGISKYHVQIQKKERNFIIKDLNSTYGTYLNGVHVTEAYLNEDDCLKIGNQKLLVSFSNHTLITSQNEHNYLRSRNNTWNKELESLHQYAKKNFPILILGESGVGKEVIARYIHNKSSRREKPFITINCSSLGESLIESELFGHVKGSFTGAICDRKGAFEAARCGTLLLDEIGDLAVHLQPRLLRALENQEIRPIGSDRSIKTDVRIIAATHQNLNTLIKKKEFRSDLLFRLNVIQIKIPALRERMEDFEALLFNLSREMEVRFSRPVIEKIKEYNWPGNIRELRNFIARASAVCQERVMMEDLPRLVHTMHSQPSNTLETNSMIAKLLTNYCSAFSLSKKKRSVLDELEKVAIREALLRYNGNQLLASDFLGISRSTFHTKLKKYQIDMNTFKYEND